MLAKMPEGGYCCIAFALVIPVTILVAVVVKLWEVWKAKSWLAAEGKVLVSSVKTQVKTRPFEESGDTVLENIPYVEYEFLIGSQKHRGTRISIGEKIPNSDLEPTLARYPVGKAVTVYYDPADPKKCVLERDLGISKSTLAVGFTSLIVFFVGGPLLVIFGYLNGVEWFKSHLADPKRAPFVAASGVFTLLVLLFAFGFSRMTRKAANWPVTRGKILSSEVEQYLDYDDGVSRTMYRSCVIYGYTVNGREFCGDQTLLGVSVNSTSEGMARRAAAKYPQGKVVYVYYNPEAPGESVVNPNSRWHYLPWVIAAVMFTLTWAAATGRM